MAPAWSASMQSRSPRYLRQIAGFQKPQLIQESSLFPRPHGNSPGVQDVGQKACPGKYTRGHVTAPWGSLGLLLSGGEGASWSGQETIRASGRNKNVLHGSDKNKDGDRVLSTCYLLGSEPCSYIYTADPHWSRTSYN